MDDDIPQLPAMHAQSWGSASQPLSQLPKMQNVCPPLICVLPQHDLMDDDDDAAALKAVARQSTPAAQSSE